ncbi:MAG: hypothetical protein LAO78_28730 [Acidobacteriia bacterium]|nr:hypothetical protein [Terriglobia bacterium]
MRKTLKPTELHGLGVCPLLADELRMRRMRFQHQQSQVMNLLGQNPEVLLPTAQNRQHVHWLALFVQVVDGLIGSKKVKRCVNRLRCIDCRQVMHAKLIQLRDAACQLSNFMPQVFENNF